MSVASITLDNVREVTLSPEDKALWVEALRSGEYEQGAGALNNAENNTYCCLGVFCAAKGIEVNPYHRDDDDTDMELNDSVYEELREQLGRLDKTFHYDDEENFVSGRLVMDQLMEWNDANSTSDNHKSFAEIADWIEENL